jgi:hypothetical protein
VAIVAAAALSIAPAVLAIGGATPPGPAASAIVRACDGPTPAVTPRPPRAPRGAPPMDKVICELDEPIVVRPVVRGPRHRGAVPYPRAAEEISDELDWMQWFHTGPLRDCYRWARWVKSDLAGDVILRVVVDEWGRLARVTPETTPAGGGDVATCFADSLVGMRLGHYVPRRTDLAVVMRLVPSGQALLPRRPARPRAWRPPPATAPPACVDQPAAVPVDRVGGPPPIVVVDDFSEEQAEAERVARFRAETSAWVAGGRRGPRPKKIPSVISCLARVRGKPDRPDVAAAVSFQRGDFEACYAEAWRWRPGGAGQLGLAADVNRAGQFESGRVRASSTGDAALDRCLAGALEHAHVPTGLGTIPFEVRVPLALLPEPGAVAATDDAEAAGGDLIDVGDGPGAADRYRAALARAPEARRCALAVGLAQAAMTAAPWLEDDRVSAAVDQIGGALRAAPGPTRAACQKLAMPLLAAWAVRPLALGRAIERQGITAIGVERTRRLLAFEPPLPGQATMRVFHGDGLLRLGHWIDAADELLRYARTPGVSEAATYDAAETAAWGYARAIIDPAELGPEDSFLRSPTLYETQKNPAIAAKLQAALAIALRNPHVPNQGMMPWDTGRGRFRPTHAVNLLRATDGFVADPDITAMEPRDAWILLRSLRIAGPPALACREARRLAAASRVSADADRRRLKGFLDACRPVPEGTRHDSARN